MPGVSRRTKLVAVRIPLHLLSVMPKKNVSAAIVYALRKTYYQTKRRIVRARQ